jgi:hypothetical protein
MGEGKFILRANIEHFRRLLASETDPAKREMIARLLEKELAELRAIEDQEAEQKRGCA